MLVTDIPVPLRTETASVLERLLDVIANPAEVFTEIAASGPTPVNWRLPTLLVCLTNLVLIACCPLNGRANAIVQGIAQAANVPPSGLVSVSSNFQLISMLAICGAAVAGTFWSAFVLWVMGRVFLKARFPYGKALEVAGLAGVTLILGALCTVFLTSVADDASARPALSLLLLKSQPGERLRGVLDVFNVFHLWSATLMAIGLAKLTATSFKESAFFVFGYWVVLRVLFFALAGAA
jgi:hypothetical protein